MAISKDRSVTWKKGIVISMGAGNLDDKNRTEWANAMVTYAVDALTPGTVKVSVSNSALVSQYGDRVPFVANLGMGINKKGGSALSAIVFIRECDDSDADLLQNAIEQIYHRGEKKAQSDSASSEIEYPVSPEILEVPSPKESPDSKKDKKSPSTLSM